MSSLSARRNLAIGAWYVAVALGLIITILPFVWAAASSLKSNDEIFRELSPFSLRSFLPGDDFSAYIDVFQRGFGRAIANTLFVSGVSVLLGLLINSMAGFALAQFRFKGDNVILALVLITFAVPADALALPLFSLVRQLGWFDSFTALIVPGIANGLIIFLFRQFFLGIPKELIEAARVDGLSWWGIYWFICVPMAKPITIGAGLLLFVFQWESFLWPLIAAPSPEFHLVQVALSRLSTEQSIVWNWQFAASTIAGLLPLVFIFAFQRQFVSALTGVDLK